MSNRTAIIIGAGPAGLTAAYELLESTDVQPLVFELTDDVGGLARTVNYKGNRIDIGGHRFFSRSDRVMDWWQKILPLQGSTSNERVRIAYRNRFRDVDASSNGPDPDATDEVMLVRRRISRIFFNRRFFDYPITLSERTLRNLGLVESFRIGLSYLRVKVTPQREERSLEDFFINRFGDRLYRTFFKDYTEKVWGVPCNEIKPEWGAQRVKGLSAATAIWHAIKNLVKPRDESIEQKGSETSLIEQFLYPKLGPGQMWQEVARIVEERGGRIVYGKKAVRVHTQGKRVTAVDFRDEATGDIETVAGDYVFSTMAIKDLVAGFEADVPADVRRVAGGLIYRDFLTVGLLLNKMKVQGEERPGMPAGLVPDNWVYVQERDVRVGRLQIFNNWSPYMVADPDKIWVGLEYFCNEGDNLWSMPDDELTRFAAAELAKIDMIHAGDVLDSVVIRVPKTYPAYFGAYDEFDVARRYLDSFENLFLVGRNGMHRYNNQDHSMLTAIVAVQNIRDGITDKENIWAVNTEEEYHEEK
ncbi:MAG: NAD(P)/FAD-dependent oxidoreductase [Deltaproteobacteria bacterium]|nr:NAD(P)/FAD-dependent oxidoreductase [Deltaproteobacteria bacterium]